MKTSRNSPRWKLLQSQATGLLNEWMTSRISPISSNWRIVNIPEGSKKDQDPIKSVSDLLMTVTGPDVFSSPPEIQRAHHSLGPRPGEADAGKLRTFIVTFLCFQEKEKSSDA